MLNEVPENESPVPVLKVLSIDPSVCLINSPLWYEKSNSQNIITNTQNNQTLTSLLSTAQDIVKEIDSASSYFGPARSNTSKISSQIFRINSRALYDAVEKELQNTPVQGKTTLGDVITMQYGNDINPIKQIKAHLELPEASNGPALQVTIQTLPSGEFLKVNSITAPPLGSSLNNIATIASGLPNALNAIDVLKGIPLSYFYNSDPDSELGIVRNIYVNLDFLYRTATDANIESQDQKEKNELFEQKIC
jgi:hypothetical protein